ncbi:hypothetical protein EDB81DRAFT_802898 [Dactylonectria macrodidyma]|uniref:Uncharacterized protein n=1 Tax=Dactylonectria macrodidyma TaxID=307937 RepID=A0A9P9EB89_9HYPO|nr:hypothetical protein EDB81DRAFT_802898 [Dactylonectria macrodidyma]
MRKLRSISCTLCLVCFDEEGIWDAGIARAYNDAYELAIENGDEPRAYDVRRLIEGEDSPVAIKLRQHAEKLSAQEPRGTSETELEN